MAEMAFPVAGVIQGAMLLSEGRKTTRKISKQRLIPPEYRFPRLIQIVQSSQSPWQTPTGSCLEHSSESVIGDRPPFQFVSKNKRQTYQNVRLLSDSCLVPVAPSWLRSLNQLRLGPNPPPRSCKGGNIKSRNRLYITFVIVSPKVALVYGPEMAHKIGMNLAFLFEIGTLPLSLLVWDYLRA